MSRLFALCVVLAGCSFQPHAGEGGDAPLPRDVGHENDGSGSGSDPGSGSGSDGPGSGSGSSGSGSGSASLCPWTTAPSNVDPCAGYAPPDPSGLIIGAGQYVYNTDSNTLTKGTGSAATSTTVSDSRLVAQTGGSGEMVRLITVTTLTVQAGAIVQVTGGVPLVIAAEDAIAIAGTVRVGAIGSTPGPGARAACAPNAGKPPTATAVGGGGGGGGGFGVAGAAGAPADGSGGGLPGPSGAAAGDASLRPLRGGCNGSAGGNAAGVAGGLGGGGGGAIELTTLHGLTISGSIDAGGGGGITGDTRSGGGGAGAGGGILLEAGGMITFGAAATVCANGGSGGEGGGTGSTNNSGVQGTCSAAVGAHTPSAGEGGDGGDGGFASTGAKAGATGTGGRGGGGGGGGVGRIHLTGASSVGSGAVITPPLQ